MTATAAALPDALDELQCFVITTPEGVEQVPFVRLGDGTVLPLVATDPAQVAAMAKEAAELHRESGLTIELVRFTAREHVAWIGEAPPEGEGDDVEPEPPAPEVRCPGCGLRLHGPVAERGGCLACYPKDTDLPGAA